MILLKYAVVSYLIVASFFDVCAWLFDEVHSELDLLTRKRRNFNSIFRAFANVIAALLLVFG